MNSIIEVPIEKISPDPNQPRKHFDKEDLEELSKSIRRFGLLQPIIAKEGDNKDYVIIAGERRYRACILAKENSIRVLVLKEQDTAEIALIENIQRKDLNKIEEANAIKRIMSEKNYTHEQVAEILSKSRPYISNKLRILNLSEVMQRALIEEQISDGHARVLVGIQEEKEKQRLLQKILTEKLSVREAERYSKTLKVTKDIYIKNAVEELEEVIGSRVYTKGNDKSGTLCINYHSKTELEEILEKLMKALK